MEVGAVHADNPPQPRQEPRCGWCCWRPNCLQVCYKWQLGLAIMCLFGLLQGFIIHGITPVNSLSLERRFKLTSIQVGWFNAVLELSAAASTILFSYLADRAHRPRWLMFSASLFAIGCFIMSLPHYIAEPYDGNGKGKTTVCQQPGPSALTVTNNISLSGGNDDCSGTKASSWLSVLIAGNVITGVGAGIIFTVGVAFIDDFSTKASSPLHIGIMYMFTAGGAAAGFAGGSVMLQLDVNFNRPDWPQFQGNKDFSTNYVGAWWLGYAIGAAGFGTVAFLFSCFDFEMPETNILRAQKPLETHKVLICVTIAAICHGLMADGLQPFFVKILRTQFVINEQKAGVAIAVIIVVAIGSGSLISGIVLRRANFGLRGLILVVLTCVTTATGLGFGFFIHCPQEKISGITVAYGGTGFDYYPSIPKYDANNLFSSCNARCGCSSQNYQPVCYPKMGVQFFSPCHGACRVQRSVFVQGRNVSIYAGCECLAPIFFKQQNLTAIQQAQFLEALMAPNNVTPSRLINPQQTALRIAYQNFSTTNVLATGVCDTSCPDFYGAMVIMFFILFLGYFTVVPLSNIVMRCVTEGDRSLALAFYQAMERFLGAIPGPIMMGGIIDRVCIFRDPNACLGDEGTCFAYDTPELSRWLVGIFIGLHAVAITCYATAFFLYKPPNGETIRHFFASCCIACRRDVNKDSAAENGNQTHDNPGYNVEDVNNENMPKTDDS